MKKLTQDFIKKITNLKDYSFKNAPFYLKIFILINTIFFVSVVYFQDPILCFVFVMNLIYLFLVEKSQNSDRRFIVYLTIAHYFFSIMMLCCFYLAMMIDADLPDLSFLKTLLEGRESGCMPEKTNHSTESLRHGVEILAINTASEALHSTLNGGYKIASVGMGIVSSAGFGSKAAAMSLPLLPKAGLIGASILIGSGGGTTLYRNSPFQRGHDASMRRLEESHALVLDLQRSSMQSVKPEIQIPVQAKTSYVDFLPSWLKPKKTQHDLLEDLLKKKGGGDDSSPSSSFLPSFDDSGNLIDVFISFVQSFF